MEDAALGVVLGVAIKGPPSIHKLNSSFEQISASLQKAGANVSALNAKIANLGSATKSINLAKAMLDDEFVKIPSALAKLGTLSVPVKLAVDYESAMVDVKKYIEFESEEQFAKMSSDIKALSAKYGVNVSKIEILANQMNFLDDKMSMVKSSELFNILNRTSSNANMLGLSTDSAAALGALC
ncbi:hypothetical protein [Campylobacter sp. JMF_08 NE1]|uniref:hypothetical protein n=1 Tax=Campylobacter sp. JMF_08 NE1 TaxID=2983821 RepID=UPI0022E9A418|nr:hypothetical protein [Campylobacter sp. JMF_08 NE1]MDA3048133.1 hypothetical protein [Campylobacter sp. JMF_08 NE1]